MTRFGIGGGTGISAAIAVNTQQVAKAKKVFAALAFIESSAPATRF
jgi:hypothetical protein